MTPFDAPHPAENKRPSYLEETEALDWHLASIGGRAGHSGQGVKIHLVDTGLVTLQHPAWPGRISSRIQPGRDFSSPASVAATDDVIDHGLALASVLVGTAVAGHRGLVPQAEVTVHKVHNWPVLHTPGSRRAAARAVRHAIEVGADIISISMGWGWSGDALRQAIGQANRAGVLVIAAAGQLSSSPAFTHPVPTLFSPGRLRTVVGVAAGDAKRRACTWSAHGDEVDLCAPGDGVWAARWYHGAPCLSASSAGHVPLLRGAGSSFAAALTAGAAALWLEHRRQQQLPTTPALFRAALRAADLPRLTLNSRGEALRCPEHWGAGWLDLPALLRADPRRAPPPRPPVEDAAGELLSLLLGGRAGLDEATARQRLNRRLRTDLLDDCEEELGSYAMAHPDGLRTLLEEAPATLLPDAPPALRRALLRSP